MNLKTCFRLAGAAALLGLTLPAALAANTTYTYRDGLGGYAGTQDTELRSNTGETATPVGGNDSISVDGDDGSPGLKPNHGLIRFDGVFGNGAGQIGGADTIVSARIVLDVFNEGSGFAAHDLKTDWSEATATWDSFVGGVQADGVEAAVVPIATFGANNSNANVPTGTLVIDVTASLQAVQAGTLPGYGWALLPFASGTNGIDFDSSESASLALRPTLVVEFTPAVPEPGTWAMLVAGLVTVAPLARRLRARRA